MIKIVLMILIFLFSTVAYSEDNENNYKQQVDEIIANQVLPPDIDKMYYLPYASAKGAILAYDDMPKPTYIVKKNTSIKMTKDGPEKPVIMYYVYFTEKND